MARTNLIRLQPKDAKNSNEFVLVHTRQGQDSRFELEIDSTEGSNVYSTNVTQENIRATRAKAFKGTDEEIQSVLAWILLRRDPPSAHEEIAYRAEAVVSVDEGRCITFAVRQRIEDITPNICTLLFQSSSKEIELFEWAGELAQSLSDANQRRRQLEETVRVKDLELNDLRGQLEELSEAKAAHENQLLEKFRQLLNSKKMKIRDQQRLLARASIDPGIGDKVKDSRENPGSAQTRKSRETKRKVTEIKEEESDSDAAFDARAAPTGRLRTSGAGTEDDEPLVTPPGSESESEHSGGEPTTQARPHSQEAKDQSHMLQGLNPDLYNSAQDAGSNQRSGKNGSPSPAPSPPVDDEETDDEL